MQQNPQDQFSAILDEFYTLLNTQRTNFKKKAMYRDRMAEQLCQELLSQNVQNMQDPSFNQIVANYEIVSTTNPDYLYYDDDKKAKGYQHTQQEIKDNFMKVLDDMINGPFKAKLLNGSAQTHIGFALSQSGTQGEKFQIVAFCTKKIASLDKMIYCNSQQESGLIFGGIIYDPNSKPYLFVLNKCTQGQIVIGPNKIMFSPDMGEFRIQIPDNYNGVKVTDLILNSQQPNILSLFVVNQNDNSFCYGQGQDFPSNFNNYQNLTLAISDVIIDLNSIEQKNGTLSILFNQQNLFQNSNNAQVRQPISRSITQAPAQGGQVRSTRAQQMREQANLNKQQLTKNQTNQQNSTTQNNLTFQNQKTPQFNRAQTYTQGVNSIQPSQLNFNQQNTQFKSNENQNPNQPKFQFNFNPVQNKPLQQQQTNQQNGIKPTFQNNQFNNPFSNNNQNTNNQTMNMSFQQSNTSAFQKTNNTPTFQINTQNNNTQQQTFKNNAFSNQNQGFKHTQSNNPFSNIWNNNGNNNQTNNNQNQFQQWQQQYNNPFQNNQFNKQPTIKFMNNNNSIQNNQQQQNQGFQQVQFKFQPQTQNNSNNHQQQQQQQNWQQQQQQNNQNNFNTNNNNNNNNNNNQQQNTNTSVVFSQLSLIDQETLKGYLKILSEYLNHEQIQKVTAMMLTDPYKFFEYYKTANEQFEQAKDMVPSKNKQIQFINNTHQDNYKQQQQQHQQSINSKRQKEVDDITLFLLTIPKSVTKQYEQKYQDVMNRINTGLITAQQGLNKLLIRKRQPINESFKGLLDNKQHSDLILQHRNDEYLCHQIVFQSNSDFIKKAIKESDSINKFHYGSEVKNACKLLVPDWIDTSALKLFILFMYTGKIGTNGDYKQLTHYQVLNLLRIGNFFFHEYLQEFLISEVIIPEITPIAAVAFLKETIQPSQHQKLSCLNAWEYLKQYSQFYLTKHLPALLRTNPNILYDLETTTLRYIIDQSLLFVVDGNKDLESILQFTADTWAEKSITKLFKKSQQSMDSCSAFDYQVVPQLSEFLKSVNPTIDYQCKIIKSQQIIDAKSISQESKYKDINKKQQKSTDTTFIQGIVDAIDNKEKDLSEWKPSQNVLQDNISAKDIFESKEPSYMVQIRMDDLKAEFEKNKGISIVFKAFDFARRSWHLKMDIDYENNVSLWIVERGDLLQNDINQQLQIGLNIPIKFSSVLMQFEIIDAAFGEYKSLIFHTFTHENNQVIGHDKFINLSQLKDKNELNLKVYMKEFTLHSCLTHYVCQNFQNFYKSDLKKIDTAKQNFIQQRNNFLANNRQYYDEYDVMNLPFYNVFQLFQSNDLKVDDENQVLGFIFYYTKIQSLNHNNENMQFITNMISQTLKFSFLSTKKILSGLRDNEQFRQSSVFVQRAYEEFQKRIGPQNTVVLNIPGSQSKNNQQKLQPRKYYDNSLINASKSLQSKSFSNGQDKMQFIDDLMEWLRNSKHNKDNEAFLYQEVKKWQNLYYDEKSKLVSLMNQYHNNYKAKSPTKFEQKRHQRRSLSNDKLFETQDSVHYQRAQTQANQVPAYNRLRTPPRQPPAFLKDDRNYQNDYDKRMQQQKPNNSHEILNNTMFNDSLRAYNGSTHYAETKVRSNQYADFSMLLQNLERSGQKNSRQNQEQGFIPYYRRNNNTQANTRSKSQSEGNECIIF